MPTAVRLFFCFCLDQQAAVIPAALLAAAVIARAADRLLIEFMAGIDNIQQMMSQRLCGLCCSTAVSRRPSVSRQRIQPLSASPIIT